MLDADVRPLTVGDTFGLTYPGNFWNFAATGGRCILGRIPEAAASDILARALTKKDDNNGKDNNDNNNDLDHHLSQNAWLPELTRDILADNGGWVACKWFMRYHQGQWMGQPVPAHRS